MWQDHSQDTELFHHKDTSKPLTATDTSAPLPNPLATNNLFQYFSYFKNVK